MNNQLISLFPKAKPVIGMIHVGALPGTPAHSQSIAELVALAEHEARLYRDGGVDGIGIENMHDTPYLRGAVGPEIVAAMTVIGQAVKSASGLPTGIQILAAANLEAMAVAHAANLDFVRVEGYVFAHVADEGLIESSAARLLRYRKLIGAARVQVWADVKKKHVAHALTADVGLGATAEAVAFMRGDAVIITGSVTGQPPQLADVAEAKAHVSLPVLLGSGIGTDNLETFYAAADGFIIGSFFKVDGHWANPVDPQRVEQLMTHVGRLRQ
jgi:uncharacterized protein